MMNPVLTMDTIQLDRKREEVLDHIHMDIQDIEDNLSEQPGNEHLIRELKLGQSVLKKLQNPKCRPNWFTGQEVNYMVSAISYWKEA